MDKFFAMGLDSRDHTKSGPSGSGFFYPTSFGSATENKNSTRRVPNAEEHQLKAALVVQLKRLIAERELTQTAAAKLIEMKQPDLSKLLRGDFRLVSVEKLMRMLTALIRTSKSR